MIGKGKIKLKQSTTIYLDKDLTAKAKTGFSGGTQWYLNLIVEHPKSYMVIVTHENGTTASDVFNPSTFYLRKEDVIITSTVEPSKPSENATLQTGDTMVLSDKNGKRIGVWTFKKD